MSETLEQIVRNLHVKLPMATQEDALEFARQLIAALGAQEPVAQVDMNKASCVRWLNSTDPDTFHGTKLYAAPQLPQREGWQCVPVEPTLEQRDEMREAAHQYIVKRGRYDNGMLDGIYKAMLAAAPKEPT